MSAPDRRLAREDLVNARVAAYLDAIGVDEDVRRGIRDRLLTGRPGWAGPAGQPPAHTPVGWSAGW